MIPMFEYERKIHRVNSDGSIGITLPRKWEGAKKGGIVTLLFGNNTMVLLTDASRKEEISRIMLENNW